MKRGTGETARLHILQIARSQIQAIVTSRDSAVTGPH